MANTLRQLIDYAKANPDSEVANDLGRAIQKGLYDEKAKQEGIDLSFAGRPGLQTGGVGVDEIELDKKPRFGEFGLDVLKGQLNDFADKTEPLGDFSEGFAKRSLSTLQNPGKKVLETTDRVLGIERENEIGIPEEFLELEEGAEKFGGFVSDVASFALPFGPASKVGKVAKGASKATKVLGLGKKALTEGVVGGGVTAAQRGEFDKESRDAAIISAAFPAAGAAINKGRQLTSGARKELAPRVVNSLIKPLLKDLSYGKNPGRAVAEEGIVAKSLDDLAQQIRDRRKNIGLELSKLYNKSDRKFTPENLFAPLDDAINQANKNPRTNSSLISRLEDLRSDLMQVRINEGGEEVAERKLVDLTADELFELKKDIGDLTKFTGTVSDDNTVNKALKTVYGKIKGLLDEGVPGTQKLNERYADLTSAEVATLYRDKIAERQNLIGFAPKLIETGGIIATFVTGNPLPLLISGGVAVSDKIASSPQAKTAFAKWLAKAGAEEKKRLIQEAPWLRGLMLELLTD